MKSSLQINGQNIGTEHLPYIIAELSANHGGKIDRAKKIIQMAKDCGADAIKLQAYTPDNITIDCDKPDFLIQSDTLWKGKRLYDLYESAKTPYSWFPELFEFADKVDITIFASPFGLDAVAMLEELNCPAYKIASFEAVDRELITACAATGKPLIISTGLCTLDEVRAAVATAKNAGCNELALLKCNSAYPAVDREANLLAIAELQKEFSIPIGYSDHTLGSAVPIAACALGASIVEKHVIDSRTPPTADSEFSALPETLREIVAGCKKAWEARGRPVLEPTLNERASMVFRRSLYVAAPVKKGEMFSRKNVRSVRPGHGLAPEFLQEICTKKAKVDIDAGTALSWDLVE